MCSVVRIRYGLDFRFGVGVKSSELLVLMAVFFVVGVSLRCCWLGHIVVDSPYRRRPLSRSHSYGPPHVAARLVWVDVLARGRPHCRGIPHVVVGSVSYRGVPCGLPSLSSDSLYRCWAGVIVLEFPTFSLGCRPGVLARLELVRSPFWVCHISVGGMVFVCVDSDAEGRVNLNDPLNISAQWHVHIAHLYGLSIIYLVPFVFNCNLHSSTMTNFKYLLHPSYERPGRTVVESVEEE